jgi:hypothetical protein
VAILSLFDSSPKEARVSSEQYREKLREMFEPCMSRADLRSHIEIVSIEWLLEMSNPDPSETFELGEGREGKVVGMSDLSKDLRKRGLQEPLVVAVGMSSGRARLEGGNHRARVLLEMGFLHAPTVCWVGASHVGFESNGLHQGREVKFWPEAKPLVAMGSYDERYFERPGAILPSAPVWSLEEPTRSRAKAAPAPVAIKPTERKPRATRAPKDEAPAEQALEPVEDQNLPPRGVSSEEPEGLDEMGLPF